MCKDCYVYTMYTRDVIALIGSKSCEVVNQKVNSQNFVIDASLKTYLQEIHPISLLSRTGKLVF